MRGMTLIVAAGDAGRFHAALAIAAAAAAAGAAVRVFMHGDAVGLLTPPIQADDDARYRKAGLPTLEQMLGEARELGVRIICCQSGLALAGLELGMLGDKVEVGGLVGLMSSLGDDRLVVL